MPIFVPLQENWDYVLKTWKSSSLISDFIESIVPLVHWRLIFAVPPIYHLVSNVSLFSPLVLDQFTSEEKAAEVTEFFAGRIKPSFERALKQSLERVRISARWIESIRSEPKLGQTVQELLQAKA